MGSLNLGINTSMNRPKSFPSTILAAIVVLVSMTVANATPITIANFSFESPDTSTFTVGDPPSWVGAGGAVNNSVWNVGNGAATTFFPSSLGILNPPGQGDQTGYINVHNTPVTPGVGTDLTITLTNLISTGTATLQASRRYTLTVAVGIRSGQSYNLTTGTWNVQLLAGGSPVGTITTLPSLTLGQMSDVVVQYVTPLSVAANTQLGVRLSAESTGAYWQVNFDNVRLDVSLIPEPTAVGISMTGMLLLARRHRVRA